MRGCLAVTLIAVTHSLHAQSLPTFVTTPTLSIGDTLTDPHFRFERLTDARRLSDGRIVAALCPKSEIRTFDGSGRFLSSLSLNDDPRAQRSLVRLIPAGGDTIGVVEAFFNNRLTLVAPDLTIVGTVPLPNTDTTRMGQLGPSRLDVIGRFADGSFVGRFGGPVIRGAGRHRRPLHLYRFGPDGALRDSLTVPGLDAFYVETMRGPGAVRMPRTTSIAVLPDRLVIGDQASAFLAEHGMDFKPVRKVMTETRPIAITDSIKAAWTRVAVDRAMTPTNGILAAFADIYPDSTPAFRDIVTGSDGRVWVQDPAGADFYPLIWTAYRGGRALARVELPPRFYPTQFGPDWVLGLAYDTTTIDRVQLLKLAAGPLTNARLTPQAAAPANRVRCGAWVSR
jgi:hypothetical protein